jgi:hypothetical protein
MAWPTRSCARSRSARSLRRTGNAPTRAPIDTQSRARLRAWKRDALTRWQRVEALLDTPVFQKTVRDFTHKRGKGRQRALLKLRAALARASARFERASLDDPAFALWAALKPRSSAVDDDVAPGRLQDCTAVFHVTVGALHHPDASRSPATAPVFGTSNFKITPLGGCCSARLPTLTSSPFSGKRTAMRHHQACPPHRGTGRDPRRQWLFRRAARRPRQGHRSPLRLVAVPNLDQREHAGPGPDRHQRGRRRALGRQPAAADAAAPPVGRARGWRPVTAGRAAPAPDRQMIAGIDCNRNRMAQCGQFMQMTARAIPLKQLCVSGVRPTINASSVKRTTAPGRCGQMNLPLTLITPGFK